jgi:hypothetical protein
VRAVPPGTEPPAAGDVKLTSAKARELDVRRSSKDLMKRIVSTYPTLKQGKAL